MYCYYYRPSTGGRAYRLAATYVSTLRAATYVSLAPGSHVRVARSVLIYLICIVVITDLVLEVESLQAGSHVRVARSVLTEQEEEDNKDVQLVKTVQTSEENTDNKNLFETGNL